MSGLAGQTSLFPPEPAPDPLLCGCGWPMCLARPAFTRAVCWMPLAVHRKHGKLVIRQNFVLQRERQQLCGRSSWPRNSTTRW